MNSESIEHLFETHRRHLLGLAYRMLGSVHDAEEVVQETFLRVQSTEDFHAIENPRAWLTRVCSRICLDRMKKLSTKLETYPGQWLPEPFVEAQDSVDLDETLSMALLVGMQALTSKERATFLLNDIFDFSFSEVADTLELNAAQCRQLAVRARKKIRQTRSSRPPNPSRQSEIIQAFLNAIRSGDAETLQEILAEDVKLQSDGGGKVLAVPYPIVGVDKVRTFLVRIFLPVQRGLPMRSSVRWFNGAPGLLLEFDEHPSNAIQLHVVGGKVQEIFIQRNPDKLCGFGRPKQLTISGSDDDGDI